MGQNLNHQLTKLLKSDGRFIDEECEVIKAAVVDHAWRTDRDLIALLLTDETVKSAFFEEISGHWLFKAADFVEYVSDKNFLADSYTSFRNRIGLTIGDKYLRERGEVALAWPYKDCVLEGGQDSEGERRKEVFFNETLARDEITRLYDPKALTHWKRYSVDGEQPVCELRKTDHGDLADNFVVKGNNLLALHTLLERFRGKVKLIYIDPPYNTGNDAFGYNDRFNHSAWLTFMRNRLEVARDLLRKDGSIWINLDDSEAHYLKVLADEVFGRENFVANVVWQKNYAPKSSAKYLSGDHDHILLYARDRQTWRPNALPRTIEQDEAYKNPDDDPRGRWRPNNLAARNPYSKGRYSIECPGGRIIDGPPKGSFWRISKEKLAELDVDNRIWWGENGNNVPAPKIFLSEVKHGRVPQTLWFYGEVGHTQEAKKETNLLLGDTDFFATPKPERLLKRIIHIGSNLGDLVLDFFAGSGTTAAVAHKMERQWITVEQMDYVDTVTVERLKKVVGRNTTKDGEMIESIEYDTGGISKTVDWQGGGEFVYCELRKHNELWLDRIQSANSAKELLALFDELMQWTFLKWYVDPRHPEAARETFIAIGAEEDGAEKQKSLLCQLLDKNQIYLNATEMDDDDFNVPDEDKRLTRELLGGNT